MQWLVQRFKFTNSEIRIKVDNEIFFHSVIIFRTLILFWWELRHFANVLFFPISDSFDLQ